MSQILVVVMYVVWVVAAPQALPRGPVDPTRLAVFFGMLAILVLAPAVAARVLVRRMGVHETWRGLRQFHWLTEVCRFGIVGWFALGVLCSDEWLKAVSSVVGRGGDAPYTLPGMLIGPLPALLAWIALWWAQYPMDRLAREQSLLGLLESDLPAHAPPRFKPFFSNNLRMQVLTTVVPLLLIALLRDAGALALGMAPWFRAEHPLAALALSAGATILVLLLAPEPLRRILRTQRLPESSLRWKLDALCRLTRTRYREVLLWKTDYAVGNAAVMGVLPQIRYVLLTDLLLEAMDDRQIEAVFAHELGHIVHRHTVWFVVVILVLMFGMGAAADITALWLSRSGMPGWAESACSASVSGVLMVLAILSFGYISRRFERQADVYAARVMQQMIAPRAIDPRVAPVGLDRAQALASALQRAATINHMPVDGRSFRHGSMLGRIRFVRWLASDARFTQRFDQSMMLLYAAILAGMAMSAAAVGWLVWAN